MEAVGYLGDAQLRGAPQERGFHEQHLVDIIDNGAARDLTDDSREVDGGDVKFGGVERDVVVLGEMVGQQTDEADEDFLDALGRLTVYDGTILGVFQVKQEDGIEHAQHLVFVDMVGMKIADDFTHFQKQMLCCVGRQRLFRLMQLHDGQVGQMYEVVDGRSLNGDMLVGHQAVAVEIVGSGGDGNRESRRIGVEVVGVKRQFPAIVMNRHPSFVNQHKADAGHEPMQQVGTKDFR